MKSLLILLALCFSFHSIAVPTALAPQSVSETSALLPYISVDSVNGNKINNSGANMFLICKNPGASSATVTIAAQSVSKYDASYGTLTKANIVMSLAAGEEEIVGPFAKVAFNDSSGNIQLTFGGAGAADVDCAAVK